jgi:hypothetical protein
MAVYQVEQYYIDMTVKGIDEEEVANYLSKNGLDDYSFDGEALIIDGIECENMAAQYEEEINELRGK